MSMGNVIFLNGCSSAGKTTLTEKLQQLLPEPYQHIGLDQFRDGLPIRVRGLNSPPQTPGAAGLNVVPIEQDGERVTRIQFGDHGEAVLAGMRRAIAAFAAEGLHVIIDDLLFESKYLEDYARVLDPEHTWFVGVHCDLEVVLQREATRIGRFPGTAKAHFEQVHAHDVEYDIDVDTTTTDPKIVCERIIDRLQSPPVAFHHLRRRLAAR